MDVEYTLLSVDNQACNNYPILCYNLTNMPIEFEEYKAGKPRYSPNGRYLGKAPAIKDKKEYGFILGLLLKLKLVKDQDHAKFVLLLIIIIFFGLAVFYGVETYNNFNPSNVNTPPINLDLITEE